MSAIPVNIVVLVKPVVDPKAVVRFRPDGTIDRSAVKLVVNPYDKYAVEASIQLKEKLGGKVVGVAMAPPHAVDALREVLAMGVDEVVLLSDPRLAGSDTLATSYALSLAVKKIEQELGIVDLVLCGIESSDSNTGHIGPEVGEWLGIPSVSYVDRILEIHDGYAVVKRLIEGGYSVMKVKLPAVLSVAGTSYQPRIPSLREVLAARRKHIDVWNADAVGLDPSLVGLVGSPTRVVRMWRIEIRRRGKIFTDSDVDVAIEKLISELKKDGVSLGV
ncbi:MAG: electron transfer flavoprotein subunit beta/FixA family protein [Sulfolobales archaeon]